MLCLTGDAGSFTGDVNIFMFLVGLMAVVLTLSAVCSQKIYFFVIKMAMFLVEVNFVFLNIGLTS